MFLFFQADFGDYEKGCVMHFTGVSEQTSREDLKELFGEYGTISWVDFERGQTEVSVQYAYVIQHIKRGDFAAEIFSKVKKNNKNLKQYFIYNT